VRTPLPESLGSVILDSRPRAPDLPTGIEDLREKREEVNRSIAKDEEEKGECATSSASSIPTALVSHVSQCLPRECLLFVNAAKIQNDLRILTERLARINDNLARKITSRNEYDKTIQETEAAYSKVRTLHISSRASNLSCASSPLLAEARATVLRATDYGEFANAAARAEARERQPHKEKAGLVLGMRRSRGRRREERGRRRGEGVRKRASTALPCSSLE